MKRYNFEDDAEKLNRLSDKAGSDVHFKANGPVFTAYNGEFEVTFISHKASKVISLLYNLF